MKQLFLLLIIGLIGYYYFYLDGEILGQRPLEYKISIVDEQEEKDSEIIKEYFASGMQEDTFKNALNSKPKYINQGNTNDQYQKIDYNFEKILSYNEIESIIERLLLSDAVKAQIIGISVDQRQLYSLEVGYGEKTIMFEAGIHAAEVANPLFIIKYLIDLVNAYETNDENTINLLNEVKIIVIPLVNPDGYEVTNFGYENIKHENLYLFKNHENIAMNSYKANANGVDLNRNFPSQHGGLYYTKYQLAKTVSTEPSIGNFDYYPGKSLGSEPETKALINWQYQHLYQTYAYIALHSAGQVIFAGKPNLSPTFNNNCSILANIVNKINNYQFYNENYEDIGMGTDGTSADFASEIISGFHYSRKTGRLSSSSYEGPKISEQTKIGIITLETMTEYTFNINKIKKEYYDMKLSRVFDELIASYKKII